MFDTTIIRQGPSYPQNVNITEHRAPTDESVKLLNEMQEKAKRNLIDSIVIDNNVVNGVIYVMEDLRYSKQFEVVFKFNINGRDFVIEEIFKINPLDRKHDLINRFYKEFSKKITQKLIQDSPAMVEDITR